MRDSELEDLKVPKRSLDLLNNVKIGQDHSRFIICENLVRSTSPMLHTKYQGLWPLVPEKKIFKGFIPYMGMAAILVM